MSGHEGRTRELAAQRAEAKYRADLLSRTGEAYRIISERLAKAEAKLAELGQQWDGEKYSFDGKG